MRSVFHLDPVASPRSIAPILALRHNPFGSHPAGCCEQFGPNLTVLDRRHEDALRAAAE
jgi:hypothetical protein